MDTTNPTNEQKTLSLEDAKAEILADCADNSWMSEAQRKTLDGFSAGRLHQNETCLAILARVVPTCSQWQPIETAPKDEEVMVIHKDYGMIQATCYSSMLENAEKAYRDFPWSSPADEEEWIYTKDLTHWMPMPDLPK